MSERKLYAIEVEENVPALMRDGTILRADIYRPREAGAFPVLLERTLYNKKRDITVALAERLASHGYVVIVQDIRGRYTSEGECDPRGSRTGGAVEMLDGYDTVEWASALPGSNGNVGTYGASHNAFLQWRMAPTRPPQLRAMFAGNMSADSRDVWPGVFTRERQLHWFLCLIVPDTRRRLGLPGPHTPEEAQKVWDIEKGKWLWFEPMAEFPEEVLGGLVEYWHYWISHHHLDWYRFAEQHCQIDVPVFHLTSWYDRFLGTIDHYVGMVRNGRTEYARRSQRLLIGPWTHTWNFTRQVGVMDFGPTAELDCAQLIVRWFDHWLRGVDTGILDEPPIRLFVMGKNEWRYEYEWPLKRTRFIYYYLHSKGGANSPHGDGWLSTDPPGEEPSDSYVYDSRDPVMSIYLPDAQAGPGDVRVQDYRRDILVFQTPTLEQDVEVTGPLEVKLYAASSAQDTDWTARLIDVYPDGFGANLTYGIQRARYRESWDRPILLVSGQVYEYTIKLKPTSNLFRRGHRIRLDISSSDFPNFDRNHNTGRNYWEDDEFTIARQTVFHNWQYQSRVILPIVP